MKDMKDKSKENRYEQNVDNKSVPITGQNMTDKPVMDVTEGKEDQTPKQQFAIFKNHRFQTHVITEHSCQGLRDCYGYILESIVGQENMFVDEHDLITVEFGKDVWKIKPLGSIPPEASADKN